ncbi:hypothetical protein [Amycolatopsis sp. lyj-108]|uniref:hypothetical protein n=1 Tax=Amycolatopsis sp. lyj-108 TaxID=2789286 RepID=UPI00397DBA95
MATRNTVRRIGAGVLAAAALATSSACDAGRASTAPRAGATSATTPPTAGMPSGTPTASEALRLLGTLRIAPEDTGVHYKRKDWKHWIGQPGTGKGCDTRERILIEQGRNIAPDGSRRPVERDPESCEPFAGRGNTWHSF